MHVYFVAFVSGWAAFGAFITIIPWEAIYVVDILGILFPQLKAGKPLYSLAGADIYIGHIVVGTIISIILYLINRRGVATSATLQRILCFALVGARILAGFETIPQGIESAGGNTKSVGKTVVITVVLSCVFYALLLILLFIPNQPVFMGGTAVGLFFAWMMDGVLLYVLDYRQRQKYSKLKRASFLFASMSVSDISNPAFMDLFEEDYRIMSFVVPKDATYVGQNLMDLGWGKNQSIFIVKIEHGTEMLMLPSGKTVVYGGDRVFAVGLSKSIQKFIDYQDVGAKYTISTLKDFMGFGETERQSPLVCVEVKVTGKEPYCGKELKDTGIQSEEHCMIVGIKREDDTIMMPHATTVIRQGDVLWVMGAEMNVEHLEALSKE